LRYLKSLIYIHNDIEYEDEGVYVTMSFSIFALIGESDPSLYDLKIDKFMNITINIINTATIITILARPSIWFVNIRYAPIIPNKINIIVVKEDKSIILLKY